MSESALDAFGDLREIYRHCIMDAQEAGEVDTKADPTPLAAFYVTIARGMEVLGAAGVSRADLTAIALTALEALPLTALGEQRRQAE